MLGDLIESALTKAGITRERVERWLGRPCGCEERREKLNQIHAWAKSVISGRSLYPQKHLDGIVEES